MAMTQQLWSISGLATELGRDRRTLARALSLVVPDGQIAGQKAWYLTSALRALERMKQGSSEREADPFTALLVDRLEHWRAICSCGEPPWFTVEQVAELSRVTQADVLTWFRLGMPYVAEGDWESGAGF